jgi:broad specificity phosphatase PhoE
VKLREFLPKSDGAFMVDSSSHSGWAMQSDYMRLYKRVSKTLVEILRSSRASTILLVSHSDVIGTLIRSLFGNHSVTFDSDFTGVSSLSWNGGRWEVAYLNRLDHLNE